jgi:hypothetical protein
LGYFHFIPEDLAVLFNPPDLTSLCRPRMMVLGSDSGRRNTMFKLSPKHLLICAFSSGLPVLMAGTPAIGVAVSQGNIVVNGMQTPGNATVFDGNSLQTGATPSQVRLKDGAQVRFAVDSRGTLFRDHVDLEKGSASISSYSVKANGLSVRTENKGSAVVTMQGKNVEIAAVTGNVHVFNAQGMNVANLIPGRSLSLRPQDAGASAPSSLVGCAVKQGNDLLLTDETSNVTVRVNGENVKPGKRVQITGALLPALGDSAQVIKVTSAKEVGGSCKPGSATSSGIASTVGAAGAGAAAGAAAGTATAAAVGTAAAATAATTGAVAGSTIAGIGAATAVVGGVAAAAATGTGSSVAATGNSGGSGSTNGVPACISPCTF